MEKLSGYVRSEAGALLNTDKNTLGIRKILKSYQKENRRLYELVDELSTRIDVLENTVKDIIMRK